MNGLINVIANTLIRFDLLKKDVEYILIRASMVTIFSSDTRNGSITRPRC